MLHIIPVQSWTQVRLAEPDHLHDVLSYLAEVALKSEVCVVYGGNPQVHRKKIVEIPKMLCAECPKTPLKEADGHSSYKKQKLDTTSVE